MKNLTELTDFEKKSMATGQETVGPPLKPPKERGESFLNLVHKDGYFWFLKSRIYFYEKKIVN